MPTPLRVLILEDAPADAELMVRELRRAGFDPHWQRVEAEADYCAHLDPALDVILADYKLPQFDAMRALQRVQERGLDIPFIVVSGAISEEVAVACMKQGAADYLLKDRLARLGPAVAQALAQHRLRGERRRAEQALRESEDRYRDLVNHSQDLICTHDLEGRILSANLWPGRILGYEQSEFLTKNIRDILAEEVRHEFDSYLATIRRDGSAKGLMRVQTTSGERRIWEYNNTLRTEGVAVPIVRAMAHDITERHRAEKMLRVRTKQQSAVAELGHRALAGTDLSSLLNEAAALVARTLEVEFCKVLEMVPDGTALLLRAGVGWKEGCVGSVRVRAGTDSQAGYTLLSNEPVIIEDPRTETRFHEPPLLREHGVVSGMSVVIPGQDRPFGVLGAHTTRRRPFTKDDVHFLSAVANVLAAAIERKQAEETLREMSIALAHAMPGISRLDAEGRYVNVNETYARMIGYEPDEMVGMDSAPTVHPDDRGNAIAAYHRMVSEGKAEFEARAVRKDGSVFHKHVLMVKRVDKEGNLIGHHCFMRDISERKWAEETRQALCRAGLVIQEPLELKERLDRLLQTARDVLRLDRLNIFLADPEGRWLQTVASLGTEEPLEALRVTIGPKGGSIAQAYLTRQVIFCDGQAPVPDDLRLKPPYDLVKAFRSRAFALLPLIVQGRAIGVIGADRKHTRRPLEPGMLELLQLFAAQAAVAIHNARLLEQVQAGRERLQTLSRQLVAVQEAERHHLARELHDEIGQMLTGIKLTLEMSMRSSPDAMRTTLGEAQGQLNDLMARVRTLSLDLRPAMLDDLGLVPALLWHFERYTAQTSVRVDFRQGGLEGRLRSELETAVYRIVQEALTNVARHAGVNEATVILCGSQDILSIQVQDQGRGFNPTTALGANTSSGLAGMSERAELLGGHLTVESAPGAGTIVTVKFPVTGRIDKRKKLR